MKDELVNLLDLGTPDKVWSTISYTLNIGNYSSIKVESGISLTVPESDPVEALNAINEELAKVVRKQARTLRKREKRR